MSECTLIEDVEIFSNDPDPVPPDPNPDPLVRGMDLDPALDPNSDPSIIMQK